MTASSIKAETIKANPLRWVWNQAKRLYRAVRGDGRTARLVRPSDSQRDRFTNQTLERGGADGLITDLFDGKINQQQWTLNAREQIKHTFLAQYMLGRGGRGSMTQADWGRCGAMLKKQYQFLQNFEQDLIDGKLSEAQAKVRLGMYFKASTQAYEQGKAYAQGLPRLPAYPGDGQTICRANCACHWDVEETEDEWLASWVLGAAEHCPDCLTNADKWNPYRIQKNAFSNPNARL